MIQRKIYEHLRECFRKDNKALLISGARQVGKTFAIRYIAKECFSNVVEINFIEQPEYKTVFSNPMSAKEILLRLSGLAQQPLIPHKTLIFFDEVQECSEIVTAIKFLVDEGSYRYVLSGSLLGIELKDIRSVPVGYMTEYTMHPIDMEEFATAVGMSEPVMQHLHDAYDQQTPVDEVIHKKMMELMRLYLVIGGMPAVVQKYLDTNNLQQVRQEQLSIIEQYKKDITRYDKNDKLSILDIFNLIPSELNAKNKRFILKDMHQFAKYERYQNAFLWLADAGVALPTYNVSEPIYPLLIPKQRNLFKLFMNDVGLLTAMYGAGIGMQILTGEAAINFGGTYENLAAQQFAANGYALYYFNSKQQGEVDFVIEHENKVLPIEIKSGKDYKRHNALSNILSNTDYGIPRAIVFSSANISTTDKTLYLPIYLLMYLKPQDTTALPFHFQPL